VLNTLKQKKTKVIVKVVELYDSYIVDKSRKYWKYCTACICIFADVEFTDYEKDVLLKLPHKEYILYLLINVEFFSA